MCIWRPATSLATRAGSLHAKVQHGLWGVPARKLPALFISRRMGMEYRAEATSLEGFIQQLAVGYLCRGYRFYFQGIIPAAKDPRAVDAKLIARYDLAISKFTRARRKARGLANVQLLRYRRHFVLLSTPGAHDPLRDDHPLKDVREVPIKLGGY